MTEYTVIIEKPTNNYLASVPDLPGVVAVGATPEEAEAIIGEAIALHLRDLRRGGSIVPEPTTRALLVRVG
jgi:predicted RNase H-like HicB family nuclease